MLPLSPPCPGKHLNISSRHQRKVAGAQHLEPWVREMLGVAAKQRPLLGESGLHKQQAAHQGVCNKGGE
jgi:hypothetical protein